MNVTRSAAGAMILLAARLLGEVSLAAGEPAPLAAGTFLVAEADLPDPRFARSVVLILDHGPSGSVGLIVNKPTDVPLAEAVPEDDAGIAGDRKIFFGGPVDLGRVSILVRSDDPPERAKEIFADVHWSGDGETVRALLAGRPSALRVFVGYAGWAAGQLEGEIERGDWQRVRAAVDDVFADDPEGLWSRLVTEPVEKIPIRGRGRPGSDVDLAAEDLDGLAAHEDVPVALAPLDLEVAAVQVDERLP